MSTTYDQALAKAMTRSGDVGVWGSATEHTRDCWPAPDRRRRCHCGCRGAAGWIGGANGIGLMSGCEMHVRRWVRDGYHEAQRANGGDGR